MYEEQVSQVPPPGGYPVQLGVTTEREMNQLWGIPFLGNAVRFILCIPHFAVLWFLNIAFVAWLLLGWIYILAYGRVPGIFVKIVTESMQRQSRVIGYALFLMPAEYPPLEPGPSKPINVQIGLDRLEINRWWGFPVFGLLIRFLILIPHIIVVALLWTLAVLLLLVLWIPILLFGRYPDWAASYFGMTLRYSMRLFAYGILLPVPYPPFVPN